MKRSAPMSRGKGFERKASERRPPAPPAKATRTATYAGTTLAAVPKEETLQHRAYMAVVRTLSCAHCGIPGPCEFAHSDHHKGTGIKSDCRLGAPLCKACHVAIGTTRIYPKAERRNLEAYMAANTRAKVRDLGFWPKSLPAWPADQLKENV